MIIGLTGTKASGKGIVADILQAKDFVYTSTSDRVREEAVERGILNYTIRDLQDIGNELRNRFGAGVLVKRSLELVGERKNIVIDGIRNVGEVQELRKQKDFILIGIDAPLEIRYKRLIERGRESDPKTWEDFLAMDRRDKGIGELNIGQQVEACMNMADIKIYNEGTLKQLEEKIIEILSKFVKRPGWD